MGHTTTAAFRSPDQNIVIWLACSVLEVAVSDVSCSVVNVSHNATYIFFAHKREWIVVGAHSIYRQFRISDCSDYTSDIWVKFKQTDFNIYVADVNVWTVIYFADHSSDVGSYAGYGTDNSDAFYINCAIGLTCQTSEILFYPTASA